MSLIKYTFPELETFPVGLLNRFFAELNRFPGIAGRFDARQLRS